MPKVIMKEYKKSVIAMSRNTLVTWGLDASVSKWTPRHCSRVKVTLNSFHFFSNSTQPKYIYIPLFSYSSCFTISELELLLISNSRDQEVWVRFPGQSLCQFVFCCFQTDSGRSDSLLIVRC